MAIRAFAALGLLAALLGLYESLNDFGFLHADGSWHVPAEEGERIRSVSLTSARLCITLVPLAFIWFFASNVARLLFLVFTALKLATTWSNMKDSFDTPAVSLDPYGIAVAFIAAVCAALLFSPAASQWFAAARRRVETVFE